MKMYGEKGMYKGDSKKKNQYGMKTKKEMGYEGSYEHMNTVSHADMSKVNPMPMYNKGYDKKAWEYKY